MGNLEWVEEGVGILKRDCTAIDQRLAVVHKAVIVSKPLEHSRVDQRGGAEPSTGQMNAANVTAGDTHIHDLHRVSRNATRQRCRGALVNHNVRPATLLPPNPIRLHNIFIP